MYNSLVDYSGVGLTSSARYSSDLIGEGKVCAVVQRWSRHGCLINTSVLLLHAAVLQFKDRIHKNLRRDRQGPYERVSFTTRQPFPSRSTKRVYPWQVGAFVRPRSHVAALSGNHMVGPGSGIPAPANAPLLLPASAPTCPP